MEEISTAQEKPLSLRFLLIDDDEALCALLDKILQRFAYCDSFLVKPIEIAKLDDHLQAMDLIPEAPEAD